MRPIPPSRAGNSRGPGSSSRSPSPTTDPLPSAGADPRQADALSPRARPTSATSAPPPRTASLPPGPASPPQRSRTTPRSLEELHAPRATLLLSERETTKRFGLLLGMLHADRASGAIDQATFEDRAHRLSGALFDRQGEMADKEYVIACDDLKIQFLRFGNHSLTDTATMDALLQEADQDPAVAHAALRGLRSDGVDRLREMQQHAATEPRYSVPMSRQTAHDLQGLVMPPDRPSAPPSGREE